MLQIRDRFIIIFDYLDLESDRKNFSNAVLKEFDFYRRIVNI